MISETIDLRALRRRQGVKWARYGADVIPAWVADMDFPVAAPIQAALDEALANSDLGYPPAFEETDLAEVFAGRMARRFAWTIEPAQVEFFSDVVQAIYIALLTLTEPGDGVVIQTPIYPPFLQAVAETGRRAVLCPLVQGERGYVIDFDALRAAIDPGTRMLLLCHPHNPTGRAFGPEELAGLAALVREFDLVAISDEIHADLMLDERPHLPFATLAPDVAERTLTLTSASKPFNIAGLCLACGVFGSAALRRRFKRLPAHVRGGRSALGMRATRAAWTAGDPWLDAVRAQLRRNRDTVADWCRGRPGIRHFPPEATYLAWLDCRGLGLGREPYAFFLEEAAVALSEGRTFGEVGSGFVRLNFATSPAILAEILNRMDAALTRLSA